MVSVVITSYNRPDILGRAIRSVLAQTYKDFEIIVVDDCSDYDMRKVTDNFKDYPIHYIRHKKNKGGAAARNTGTSLARGKYVAFLDDDDEWKSGKLLKQVDIAEKLTDDYGVIYCGSVNLDDDGQVVWKRMPAIRGDIRSGIIEKGLATVPSSHFFRKNVLDNIGGYDEILPTHNEHDIWMKLAEGKFKADFVEEYLVTAHIHNKYRMSSDVDLRIRGTKIYCDKWQPRLERWMGREKARKYLGEFYARIIIKQAASLLEQNKFIEACGCFWLVVRDSTLNIKYYFYIIRAFVYRLLKITGLCPVVRKIKNIIS